MLKRFIPFIASACILGGCNAGPDLGQHGKAVCTFGEDCDPDSGGGGGTPQPSYTWYAPTYGPSNYPSWYDDATRAECAAHLACCVGHPIIFIVQNGFGQGTATCNPAYYYDPIECMDAGGCGCVPVEAGYTDPIDPNHGTGNQCRCQWINGVCI